jgi:phage terminase large subunit-like protein
MRIEDFEGRRCWAGLDLSATKDLTAKVLVFEDGEAEDGKPKFAAFAHGYTPKDTLAQRALLDKAPYDVWERQGFLTATPGSVIRYDHVAADLVDDQARFDLVQVAYDRFLIKHFEQACGEVGAELPLTEHGQGLAQRQGCPPDCDKAHEHKPPPLWMPGSITSLEELILESRIRFHINPALRSAVASARFFTSPAGLRRFEKQKPGGRIDLAVALAMAVGAAVAGQGTTSGYVVGRLVAA